MPILVHPSTIYKDSFLAALREFQQEGRYNDADVRRIEADFAAFVRNLRRRATEQPTEGRVRETIFWLVEGKEFIGRVAIRHRLNERLRLLGGHIGYEIRPAKRRRGYGTQILALALPEARKIGLLRVLITCDATNIGSRKIIEANGGQFQDEISLPGRDVPTRRYWLDIP